MGSGKSVIAAMAANRSLLSRVDLDDEIARRHGATIADLFEDMGETEFRSRECRALEDLPVDQDLILACGGGIVETPRARRILADRGVVIWLDISWRFLRRRLRTGKMADRPLVRTLGEGGIEALYRRRRPLYAAVADFRLPCDTAGEEEIARQVLYCRLRYKGQVRER